MSADGSTVIVGAPRANKACIYRYDEALGNWIQLGSDIDGEDPNDSSGGAVAISDDGKTAIIGAVNNDGDPSFSSRGHARVYSYDGVSGEWIQLGSDIDSTSVFSRPFFGRAVALGADGRTAIISAPRGTADQDSFLLTGSVQVYRYDQILRDWVQLGANIIGDERSLFGESMSSNGNGNIVIGGAVSTKEATAYSYDESLGEWVQLGNAIQGVADYFSDSAVALNRDGHTAIVGADSGGENNIDSGHAKVYRYDTTLEDWRQLGESIDGETEFDDAGESVAISADGQIVAVGAPGSDKAGDEAGSTRIFRLLARPLYSSPENTAFVTNVEATDDFDSEGSGLIYSLSGGEDITRFTLDASTGVLAFAAAPDFEAPGDIGGDNIYKVQITVTDSDALTDVRDLEIFVTDLPENTPPVIALNGAASVVVECVTSSYVETATASDMQDADSSLQLVVTGGPVSTAVPGTFMLTYNVTDSGGLSAAPVTARSLWWIPPRL